MNQILYSYVARLLRFSAHLRSEVVIFMAFYLWHTHCVSSEAMSRKSYFEKQSYVKEIQEFFMNEFLLLAVVLIDLATLQ
jgi:hypothetical protein